MQPSQQRTFEELRPQVAVGKLLDRFDQLAAPLAGDDVAGHQVLANAGRLEQAAADGEQPAGAAAGRIEVRRGNGAEFEAAGGKHPPQFGKGQHRVHFAGNRRVLRLGLLRDARPEEDDDDVRSAQPPHHPRHGDHWRDDRDERFDQLGVIPLDVTGDRRARRRDQPLAVGLRQQAAIFAGDQVRAEGDLVDAGEAKRPHHPHHLLVGDAEEFRGEAGRHAGNHRPAAGEEFFHVGDIGAILFRALRALPHAVAADDAPLRHHLGLAGDDADRLRRALADARVAHAAAFLQGGDEDAAHGAALAGMRDEA